MIVIRNLLLILLSIFYSCDKCPPEIEIVSPLFFKDSALGLRDAFVPDTYRFVDGDGEPFTFEVVEQFDGLMKMVQEPSVECDNGNKSAGIYLADTVFKRYTSGQGDEINLTLQSWYNRFVLNESEIREDPSQGIDFFKVEIILNGCDTLSESRFVQLNNGNSNVLENDAFIFRKHNQAHPNIFTVGVTSYPEGIFFAHGKGLVAFNYCGRDWVQVAD